MTDIETAPPTLAQKIGAEALGTFVLVFFGVGAAIATGDVVAIALAFGISVLVMVYAVGHISGGHFNPAVSIGAAVAGRLSWVQAGIYAATQVVAAIVAAAVLFTIHKGVDGWDAEGSMGQNGFGDLSPGGGDFAIWAALLVEVIATAIFLYVILAATDKRNPSATAAPAAIGLALTGIHLAVIPLTGTSVNPARSIGPALFAGTDSIVQLWLFIVAPLLGAAIAGITYALIFGADGDSVPGSGINFGGNAQATGFAGGWDPNAVNHQGGFDPNAQQWGGQQQWGQSQQGYDPNAQQWGGGQAPQAQPVQQPGQQWGAEQQWGGQPQQFDPNQPGQPAPGHHAPGQQQWGAPEGQQPPPQQWGNPEGPDDASRTQIRPND